MLHIQNNKYWYRIKSLIPSIVYEPLLFITFGFRKLWYLGKNYYCPVCNSWYRKFLNYQCPGCGSDIRQRTLWLFLKRKTNFFIEKLKVLHIAPEHCFYHQFKKQKNLTYLSADLASPRAMIKMDITTIPLPENSFDVIISSHVIEHVDEDIKAISELYRIQSLTGWSIHLVPIDYSREQTYQDAAIQTPSQRQKHYGHHDHKRIYGRDFINRLKTSGFQVIVYNTADFCNANEIKVMQLKTHTEIFFCIKQNSNS